MIKKQIPIISIVLALIGIIGEWVWIFLPPSFLDVLLGTQTRALVYFSLFLFLCFLGLVAGMIGIASNKKIAILGIFLSLVGFLIGVFFLMIESGFISTVA
ncbi:MAG: hypothetical protein QXO12_03170 [Candidatus Pacearchaeota archaeon]